MIEDPTRDERTWARVAAQVDRARACFETGRTRELSWRRQQLDGLLALLHENSGAIEDAVYHDMGRHGAETYLSEIWAPMTEAKRTRRKLRRWTKDSRVRSELSLMPSKARVRREPRGTCLILGPWNYPFNLTLMPLIGALAAGNTVVLKPSELAPASASVLTGLLPEYLDSEAVRVVEGDADTATALLAQRFDHIFYTGNGAVGSLVMEAAAKHLTPVTLELGGKSPVWVDDSYPLEESAGWIAWGKYANCGQTCVAPDYVVTTPDVAPRFIEEMRNAITRMFGEDPQASPDFGRIINIRHTARLERLLESGQTVIGGEVDALDRYIAPTVLSDVSVNDAVMQEEIFGPILPVIVVADHQEAIATISGMSKPLALYAFTTDRRVKHDFTHHTSSGGLVFGAVMAHLGIASLPFGGVGGSGFGSYHGEYSLRTFSHERAVFEKGRLLNLAALGRPPYTPVRQVFLRRG